MVGLTDNSMMWKREQSVLIAASNTAVVPVVPVVPLVPVVQVVPATALAAGDGSYFESLVHLYTWPSVLLVLQVRARPL